MERNLSYSAVFTATAVLGFANAVARPVVIAIEEEGLSHAALSTFGLNPVVLAALFISLGLGNSQRGRGVSPRQLTVIVLLCSFFLVPSATVSWIALSLVGIFISFDKRAPRAVRAGAAVLTALALRDPASRILLHLFAEPLLSFDAAAAGIWLTMADQPVTRSGNMLSAKDGRNLLVMSGCSSFTNLSHALLFWFAISRAMTAGFSAPVWTAGLLIVVTIPLINHVRLALMANDLDTFTYIHDGDGSLFFEGVIALTVLALTVTGIRYEKSRHSMCGPAADYHAA